MALTESLKKDLRREKKSAGKEERWLLREVKFLENFKEDVEEILKLKEKIDEINKLSQRKNIKQLNIKIGALNAFIARDKKKFKKLNRLLGRSERRRVRYEKRVFSNIKLVERALDQATEKSLDDLLNQIHVYSARVISEISWRVGKIEKLTEAKTVDLESVQEHIRGTLEAAKALLALMEHLQKLMGNIENQMHRRKLIQPIRADIANLSGFLRECAIKTALLKSVVPLKYFLEKGLGKKSWTISHAGDIIPTKLGKKYLDTIEQYLPELQRLLNTEEIEQVKHIGFAVPEGATLIFVPGWKRPLLGFNMNKISNFEFPGWLFHALPEENLKKVVRDGNLSSPMEIILEKKIYLSEKFWRDPRAKRLTDGISFAFQDHEKYRAYTSSVSKRLMYIPGKVGGFFIFPLINTLGEGLIQDFANTIDGYPEIDLRDKAYMKTDAHLIKEILVAVRRRYSKWLERYSDTKSFFEDCHKKKDVLISMLNYLQGEECFTTEERTGVYYFAKEFKASKELYPSDAEEIELFKRDAFGYGKGGIYKGLHDMGFTINRDTLQGIISYVESNNFFQFSLYVNSAFCQIMPYDDYLMPPLARFPPGQSPIYFDGTIFKQGLDYLYEQKLYRKDLAGLSIILTLMKEKPTLFFHKGSYGPKDYLDVIKKMRPKEMRKLIKMTRAELIHALSKIIPQRFRAGKPRLVPIKQGVLFVDERVDKDIINNAVGKDVPVFAEIPQEEFTIIGGMGAISFILHHVLKVSEIKKGRELAGNQSYFYRKGASLFVHDRRNEREFRLS